MKNNPLQNVRQLVSWQPGTLRSMLRSKRVLISAASVAFIVIALLAVPALIDINSYRSEIASQLEQRHGRPVTLCTLSLRLLPSVNINSAVVAIADDPRFAQGAFISAR